MEKPLGLLVALFLVAFTFTTVGRLHILAEVRIWVEIARVRIRPLKKKLIRPAKKNDPDPTVTNTGSRYGIDEIYFFPSKSSKSKKIVEKVLHNSSRVVDPITKQENTRSDPRTKTRAR